MSYIGNLKNKRFLKKLESDRAKRKKHDEKYQRFLREGGARSGVYDVGKKDVKKFVKTYKDFIPKREIYKRDKKGNLVSKYKKYR